MFANIVEKKPSLLEALSIVAVIVAMISLSIGLLEATPHIPIVCVIFLLMLYGLLKGARYKELEASMIAGASSGVGAIYIFLGIGLLISSWIVSGTIPTLLYAGLTIVSASFFYAIVFLITAIVGTAIGSSLTTVATLGIAFIGIAGAIDASLAITAGAIVSGAFFGDKMSPLSDTTLLAASIVGIDLFEHIKNMSWTTVPAFIISAIIYALISPSSATVDTATITLYQETLLQLNFVHWYALIPLLVLIVCTLFKVPAFLTLLFSAVAALLLSTFHLSLSLSEYAGILYGGYTSTSGIEVIDSLLTRGGMSSMYFTIILVLLTLTMGSLLFALGIIQRLLEAIDHLLTSIGSLITGTAFTAIGINILIGEQYLSILLTGEAYKEKFKALDLHPKNLGRVIEDAGTVINPIVPWSVCGLFIVGALDVPVMSYLPFAFFCLLSPLLTILYGWLNITLTKSH